MTDSPVLKLQLYGFQIGICNTITHSCHLYYHGSSGSMSVALCLNCYLVVNSPRDEKKK